MNETLIRWLLARDFGEPERQEPIQGGSINACARLFFRDGRRLFLKWNDAAPADLFTTEAASLLALRTADTLKVPAVLGCDAQFLLLEDLGDSVPSPHYWSELGEGLARLHAVPQPRFGFTTDNYCGATPQSNTPLRNGHDFFAERRLLALGALAYSRGLLTTEDFTALEAIAHNLQRWIPDMPPVLLHGDLWSGNVLFTASGAAALIDPACYWGWAETDLAMSCLFGGFDARFYEAYCCTAANALAPDWRERVPIYNLYHLLNHLLLFGSSYHSQIRQILSRYV